MKRLAVTLALALAACSGDGAPRPTAMDPVSADEAAELARRFEAAVEPCVGAKISLLLDIDNVIRRAVKASGLKPNEERELYKGMKMAAPRIGDQLCVDFPDDSDFTLLRIRDIDGQPRPLFRNLSAKGVNYFELELGKSKKDQQVRIIDMYIYLSGENLSETFAQLARASIGALRAGDDVNEFGDIVKARKVGDDEEARRLLGRLPPRVRDSKPVLLMELQLIDAEDPDYLGVVEKIERAFPGDPAIDMVSIDGFFLREEVGKLLTILDRLDRRVGGDPYLGYLRANAYLLEPTPEHLAAAETSVREAIARLPDRWDPLFGLLTVQVKQQRYPEAMATLTTLRDRFDVSVDHDVVAGDADWQLFLATPAYQQFIAP
jgi:hypothetical protein